MSSDNKDLMVHGQTLPGLLVGEEADRLADFYAQQATLNDYGRLSLPVLPSMADRVILQKRVGDLEEVLSGIGPGSTKSPGGQGWRQARQAFAALFAGYGSLRNANIPEMLDTYLAWLREFPAYAIVDACRQVGTTKARWRNPATGETEGPDPDFAPSTSAFHLLCSAVVKSQHEKLAQIERVLRIKAVTPTEPSPEERDRVNESMRKFVELRKMPLANARTEALDARAAKSIIQTRETIAAAYRGLGYEPPKDGELVSPGLLKSLGRWPPVGARRLDE